MARVHLVGIDRPGLVAALAARGIAALASPAGHAAISAGDLVAIGGAMPAARLAAVRRRWAGLLMLIDEDEAGLIAALDGDIDDAVPHDMSDALIAARIAALLRRQSLARPFQIGDLVIDTVDRRVTRGGRDIALLPREYRLLLELARSPGEIVSRPALVQALCGLAFDPGTNVIEVHVSRLRAKLDRGFAAPMLVTEKGRGYRLAASMAGVCPAAELAIAAAAAAG